MVVKRDARADHVKQRRASMAKSRLQERDQLLRIAGKGTAYEIASEIDGHRTKVDGRQLVHDSALCLGAVIRGGRELAFRKTIHAVVFHEVNHRNVAAEEMDELTHADRSLTTVPTDAARDQCPVRQNHVSPLRRTSGVDAVQAVRLVEEIRR